MNNFICEIWAVVNNFRDGIVTIATILAGLGCIAAFHVKIKRAIRSWYRKVRNIEKLELANKEINRLTKEVQNLRKQLKDGPAPRKNWIKLQ